MTRRFVVGIAAVIGCLSTVMVASQTQQLLRVRILLIDSDLNVKPVPKHVVLITPRSPAAEPRRFVMGMDGTADTSLPPGDYVVQSEKPVEFQGKSYRWTQSFTMKSGVDTLLELSVDNATIESNTPRLSAAADLPSLFRDWQNSVVTVWSDTGHGSGFLIDRKGLVATNQHVVGRADSVQVQLSPTVKVPATVLAANPTKDVAVLWIDPQVVENVRPVRLAYAVDGKAPVVEGQQVFTIGSPLHQRKLMTSGIVSRIEARAIISDVNINHGNSGGPLFATDGQVIGITTFGDFSSSGGPGISGIVRIDEAREVIAEAVNKSATREPPKGTLLPIEPLRPFPVDALKEAVQGRKFKVSDYQLRAADFDVTFVTPVLTYGVQYQTEQANLQERAKRNKKAGAVQDSMQPFEEFKNWAEYVGEFQPVLMIRATPKLVEGFWSAFGRGLAESQGRYAGPANMHFKADFYKMRVFCGATEVTPIHPFKIEHRVAVSNTAVNVNDATYEGLYVFEPSALGPHCGSVRMVLFTEKEPEKGDNRVIDAKSLQQIWQDFAPYRAAGS
jgi:S1-C subfamily serine protease